MQNCDLENKQRKYELLFSFLSLIAIINMYLFVHLMLRAHQIATNWLQTGF